MHKYITIKKKDIYNKYREEFNGKEGSALLPHMMAGGHVLRCQVNTLFFLSQNIRQFVYGARLLEFRYNLCYLCEIRVMFF